MNNFFLFTGVALITLMGVLLIRLIKGPSIVDRVMATNVIGTKTVIILMIIGQWFDRLDMFVDLALTYALLSFISSIAAARFIKRRRDTAIDFDRSEIPNRW